MTDANLTALFGAGGPLAACLTGFRPRPEQLAMAQGVAAALVEGHSLVVEAGTGTGKTLAYLIPALDSGLRVVISTGTKTLQDQLFHRDLPMLGKAVGRPVDAQLLKGRANYLCLYRLNQLTAAADELVGKLTGLSGSILRHTRKAASLGATGSFAEALDTVEKLYLDDMMQAHDAHEGLDAFMGKRAPVWQDK